jgi:hypothetical protein
MRSPCWLVLPAVLGCSLVALGADPAPSKKPAATKAAAKSTKLDVPKIDLSGLGTIPKGDGIVAKRVENEELTPRFGDSEVVTYEVVGIGHARSFTGGAKGLTPVGGMLRSIALSGDPLSTPPFTTVVRVRSSQKGDAPIEVVILDPSGDTALSGSGVVRFKNPGTTDWQIDWDPTPRPRGGTYKVLVRVGGKPMGTWSLDVTAEKK